MSRSSYYKGPLEASRLAREPSRATLRGQIEEMLEEWPAYGYRMVTQELRRRGVVANHKRVAKLMREEALTPRRIRKFIYEYKTMRDVTERLPHFLEQVYNRRRLHPSLGYVPPEEYEVKYTRPGSPSPAVQLST